MIRFRVNGIPAPQGSKRHVGGGRMVEMSKAVGPWREAVRAEAQRAIEDATWHSGVDPGKPVSDALSVTVVFVLARPKGHMGGGQLGGKQYVKQSAPAYPAKRPDLDKLARAVLDGLVMGGVMADDSQVVSLNCAKVYARNGMPPGALVEVEAM